VTARAVSLDLSQHGEERPAIPVRKANALVTRGSCWRPPIQLTAESGDAATPQSRFDKDRADAGEPAVWMFFFIH